MLVQCWPPLVQCWPTVYDVGPTLAQLWVDVSCLLGWECYGSAASTVCDIQHQNQSIGSIFRIIIIYRQVQY